jgi:hypothetical protein
VSLAIKSVIRGALGADFNTVREWGGWVGGQKVLSRPLADSFAVSRRTKCLIAHNSKTFGSTANIQTVLESRFEERVTFF